MHVLTNTTAAMDEVWAGMASEIEDKLANARTNETRVFIIQQYLLRQSAQRREDPAIGWCLKQAESAKPKLSVKQLSSETGLSQRHLSRRFQDCVGLSPKEYLRVSRFIRSLQYLKQYPARDLTDVAYESGYYDQAHCIRDYQSFTGHTPREIAKSGYILY